MIIKQKKKSYRLEINGKVVIYYFLKLKLNFLLNSFNLNLILTPIAQNKYF